MSKVDISRARVQRLIDMDAVPNYVVAELLNEVERLQRSITGAMDHLSNGNFEAGARLLRECFWGTAPEPEATEFWDPTPETGTAPVTLGKAILDTARGDAKERTLILRRQQRCPHGVSELNHCERCD